MASIIPQTADVSNSPSERLAAHVADVAQNVSGRVPSPEIAQDSPHRLRCEVEMVELEARKRLRVERRVAVVAEGNDLDVVWRSQPKPLQRTKTSSRKKVVGKADQIGTHCAPFA